MPHSSLKGNGLKARCIRSCAHGTPKWRWLRHVSRKDENLVGERACEPRHRQREIPKQIRCRGIAGEGQPTPKYHQRHRESFTTFMPHRYRETRMCFEENAQPNSCEQDAPLKTNLAAFGDPIPNGTQQRIQEVLVVFVRHMVSCGENLQQ